VFEVFKVFSWRRFSLACAACACRDASLSYMSALYGCLVYMYVCVHTQVHLCVHANVHTCIHVPTCIHMYIDAYIHTYMHTYIHTCMQYVCVCMCVCLCMCIYVCMHVHTHIHTHTHTHTCLQRLRGALAIAKSDELRQDFCCVKPAHSVLCA